MEDYKYAKDYKGNICRIHIEQDYEPWNPRTERDGHVGHMMCWWNRYSLGDKNEFKDPEDFLNDLVRGNVSEKKIINFVKSGKTSNELELKYNRSENLWELWGYWKVWWDGNKVHHGIIKSNYPIGYLVDDIIDAMNFEDKWTLLESEGFYYLPLHIYEHGGITMNVGGFSCPWDSGQAGWIYTTKEEIFKCGGKIKSKKGNYIKVTARNWKEAAQKWLEDEVEEYDMYLQGECYGYIVDELEDAEEDEWNENVDSCWGFYSSKWGDDLIEEIALEAGFDKVFDNLEDVA